MELKAKIWKTGNYVNIKFGIPIKYLEKVIGNVDDVVIEAKEAVGEPDVVSKEEKVE